MMKRTSHSTKAATFAAIFILLTGTSLFAQETRDLPEFEGIGIGIHADVYYTQGNTHQITIEGNDKDVRELITEVKDGFLKLKYDDWQVKRSKLTIYITSEELERVSISGSAKFKAESLNSDEMEMAISGSGSVTLEELQGDEVGVKISGSGNVIIEKGKADEMEVKISGSGKLLAERFEVSEFEAAISGSGSCKITATEELDAKLSGSGSIYYHGNPRVNSVSSGSGKLKTL